MVIPSPARPNSKELHLPGPATKNPFLGLLHYWANARPNSLPWPQRVPSSVGRSPMPGILARSSAKGEASAKETRWLVIEDAAAAVATESEPATSFFMGICLRLVSFPRLDALGPGMKKNPLPGLLHYWANARPNSLPRPQRAPGPVGRSPTPDVLSCSSTKGEAGEKEMRWLVMGDAEAAVASEIEFGE
ncbi:hypothetical protein Droror1_Dr00000443 [Drosera rotundifolia]